VQNRSAYLLLSLMVLVLTTGWAPPGLGPGAQAFVERDPMLGSTRTLVRSVPPTAPKLSVVRASEALPEYALYLPTNVTTAAPLRVLVALHGMGGNGPDFAQHLLPVAERYGWAVLAPTLAYRDYRDPEQVRRDGEIHPRLKALLDQLPARTGLNVAPQVMLYGFSRGSQEAHRFSFMYPEATLAVAGMSAGSYTLPSKTFRQNSQDQLLSYPYGTADVDKMSYWIAVGEQDNRMEDVPRQWDPYVGKNRVERAQRFVSALQQFGARAKLTLFPSAAHEVTDGMRDAAAEFLATASGTTVLASATGTNAS
jgi:predicted esterase